MFPYFKIPPMYVIFASNFFSLEILKLFNQKWYVA